MPVTWVRVKTLKPSIRNSSACDSLNRILRETRRSRFQIFGSRKPLRGARANRALPPEPFTPPPGVEQALLVTTPGQQLGSWIKPGEGMLPDTKVLSGAPE